MGKSYRYSAIGFRVGAQIARHGWCTICNDTRSVADTQIDASTIRANEAFVPKLFFSSHLEHQIHPLATQSVAIVSPINFVQFPSSFIPSLSSMIPLQPLLPSSSPASPTNSPFLMPK
jgi:hypothetical protein